VKSTMGDDLPLTVTSILRHGAIWHGDREVVTAEDEQTTSRVSYEEIAIGAAQLAHALRQLGVDGDDRVGTYLWNNREHLEAYLAVPACTRPTSGCSLTSSCRRSTWRRTGCCWSTPTCWTR
jgi:fatty-acyl-CoA synthase